MKKIKQYLHHIFIDGLSGMALGLFSTLIVGTILEQIGKLIGGNFGNFVIVIAGVCKVLTGAGIGVGIAFQVVHDKLFFFCGDPGGGRVAQNQRNCTLRYAEFFCDFTLIHRMFLLRLFII